MVKIALVLLVAGCSSVGFGAGEAEGGSSASGAGGSVAAAGSDAGAAAGASGSDAGGGAAGAAAGAQADGATDAGSDVQLPPGCADAAIVTSDYDWCKKQIDGGYFTYQPGTPAACTASVCDLAMTQSQPFYCCPGT